MSQKKIKAQQGGGQESPLFCKLEKRSEYQNKTEKATTHKKAWQQSLQRTIL